MGELYHSQHAIGDAMEFKINLAVDEVSKAIVKSDCLNDWRDLCTIKSPYEDERCEVHSGLVYRIMSPERAVNKLAFNVQSKPIKAVSFNNAQLHPKLGITITLDAQDDHVTLLHVSKPDGWWDRLLKSIFREIGLENELQQLLDANGQQQKAGQELGEPPTIQDGSQEEYNRLFDWYYRSPLKKLTQLIKIANVGKDRIYQMHGKYVDLFGENPMPDDTTNSL